MKDEHSIQDLQSLGLIVDGRSTFIAKEKPRVIVLVSDDKMMRYWMAWLSVYESNQLIHRRREENENTCTSAYYLWP